jgi:YidC/Oxa1 family membrane protein insertase
MTTIENRRFALFAAVGVILFLLYQAWQKDFAPKPQPVAEAPAAPVDDVPGATSGSDDVPAASSATPKPSAADPAAAPAAAAAAEQRITVQTDKLTAVISTRGGDLRRLVLIGFPVAKQRPDDPVALLDDQGGRLFVVQSGLTSAAGPIATHNDVYRSAHASYALADGADTLEVPLEFSDAQGRRVVKTWRFTRGSYVVELSQRLANGSAAPVTANPYVQLHNDPFAAGEAPPFTPTFAGIGLYQQKEGGPNYRFHKVSFDDLAEEPVEQRQAGGWLAMLQHYFLAAVIPPADDTATFIAKPHGRRGHLGQYVGAPHEIAPGAEQAFTTRLYLGPKVQSGLAPQPDTRGLFDKVFDLDGLQYVAPGLELTLDYGVLGALAKPLYWLLSWFHELTHNWGAAIILLTFAVKLAMFKLSEAQYRGMAKMKKYAPRIQELKERYGDDRERMHKAMMELYKKEKFNPLAGCWPLLIQFPVFIALYWVLLESVELRQADFALWLNDLSAPDPFYVMPALFAITMFVQQRLSGNVVMDPMQQRVMSLMPWMMGVFFAFFPVGLVLYWFVSNLIGIAQQWYITRKLEREGLSHR